MDYLLKKKGTEYQKKLLLEDKEKMGEANSFALSLNKLGCTRE